MRSDVIRDFQEPYRAVLVDEDDIAALLPRAPNAGRRGSKSISIGQRGSIAQQGPSQVDGQARAASCHCKGTIL